MEIKKILGGVVRGVANFAVDSIQDRSLSLSRNYQLPEEQREEWRQKAELMNDVKDVINGRRPFGSLFGGGGSYDDDDYR